MFSSVFLEGTNIESSWKSTRSVKDSESQTTLIGVKESESQSIERNEVQIQTKNPADEDLKLASYDEKSLAAFLKRVTPAVLRELDKNSRSHAFDDYELMSDESNELVAKLHSLNYSPYIEKSLAPISLTWNSTGSVIAVAYMFLAHEDWCEHSAGICVWNLNRKDFKQDEPHKTIEYGCCISCVKFHPDLPYLLAAGNFIGEILLIDLSRDADHLLSITETGNTGHNDSVTDIQWVKTVGKNSKENFQVVTSGLDGKILIWNYNSANDKLQLINAFILVADNLPRSLHVRSNRLRAEVGVTALSFNVEDSSVFLIGSEGGGVFQCNTLSEVPANSETEFTIPLKNAVRLPYEPHKGHLRRVSCSTFSRDLFLTCGADGEIRVYNLNLANKVLRTLHSDNVLVTADWSPSRPLLVAAITNDGFVNFYDLRSSSTMLTKSIKAGENDAAGCSLEFCKKSPKLLATGTTDGRIQIWSLAEKMTIQALQEFDLLRQMEKIE